MEIFGFFGIIVALLGGMVRIVNQYERGVVFTLGKYTGLRTPGLNFLIPVVQRMEKVDIRIKADNVPDQKAITRDNVMVNVNAVLYYKVTNPEKAIIEVENFMYAVSQYAQTSMRNLIGEVTLDELLSNRDALADRMAATIGTETVLWGINVQNVELKDISLSPEMERTMSKQAEAERERRAVILNSEGELSAATNIADAARILAAVPGALHLRTLQSINDMSSDQSNTVVYMVPTEALKALEGFAKMGR